MTTSFPRVTLSTLLLAAFLCAPLSLQAQVPASSARYIPNEIEKSDPRASQVINRAETHFKQGELNLRDNKRFEARDEFDKAVDAILESGMDVRSNQRLQNYYWELIKRINCLEVPGQSDCSGIPGPPLVAQADVVNEMVAMQTPQTPQGGAAAGRKSEQQPSPQQQVGFREQKFEPSPLDELSKLVLTPEEQNVNPEDVHALETAKNAVDFGFNVNPLIQQFINYYQGRGRSTMETGLRRSGRYMRMARQIFRQEGVPEDITWLGQVESAWRPSAFSSAAASGLWQFVPATGRDFGLRQTAWVDERNSFEKATHASARYLKQLAARYNGDWELAMAAYNTGPLNVDRAIARSGQRSFWAIYPYIAQETRNYVPNILATILIAKNPEKFGFHGVRPETPMAYDVVQVPNATSLQLIADVTDTSVDYLRSINPELRRDVTPRGEAYQVRVPAGKSKQFVAVLKRIPVERRDSARVISVAPGEDLEAVAQRTGTSVDTLKAMNGGVDAKSAGGKLVVPKNNVALTTWKRAKPVETAASSSSGPRKVRANAGDTVGKIAARYNVSADEVARMNGVTVNEELPRGKDILLPAGANAPAPSGRRGR
jgi:membrane-bound lytic murein transglycosylase D